MVDIGILNLLQCLKLRYRCRLMGMQTPVRLESNDEIDISLSFDHVHT